MKTKIKDMQTAFEAYQRLGLMTVENGEVSISERGKKVMEQPVGGVVDVLKINKWWYRLYLHFKIWRFEWHK